MNRDELPMPPHIEDTVRSIAELHAEHDRQASLYQRTIERLMHQLGRPTALVVIGIVIVLWIGANVALRQMHFAALDPAPFGYMQGVISTAALFMTVLILASQRHENRLAEHRAQLTLQLAMVSEQKIAKLIELVERQRFDNPQMANRIDREAEAMAQPADPAAILQAVHDTHGRIINDERALSAEKTAANTPPA
jgi:uncharacterized membrane protein